LITEIDKRIGEIEEEMLDKREISPVSTEESKKAGGPLRQILNEMALRQTEEWERNQLADEPQVALANSKNISNGDIDKTGIQDFNIPNPEVSKEIIAEKIIQLISHIRTVKSIVSPAEWKALQQASNSNKNNDENTGDYFTEKKKLHGQHNRSQSITIPRYTPSEIKKQKAKYAKEQLRDNEPDISIVLKNAIALIRHAALYCHEITELCLSNVIKAEYYKNLNDEAIQLIWIVNEIEPLPLTYPPGCSALSVLLTNEAKEVIRGEIEFLRDIDKRYLGYYGLRTPLFPLKLSPQRYSAKQKTGGKIKVKKTSLQQQKMNRFIKLLKDKNLLAGAGYERLREEGICQYYSGLIKDGVSAQDIIQRVQRFARYSQDEDVKRVISKIQKK